MCENESLYELLAADIEWLAREYGRRRPRLSRMESEGDIRQAAWVGVMRAVATYDESRGASLKTFAVYKARRAVADHLAKCGLAPRGSVAAIPAQYDADLAAPDVDCRSVSLVEQEFLTVPAVASASRVSRQICVRHFVRNESLADIADDLRMTTRAVVGHLTGVYRMARVLRFGSAAKKRVRRRANCVACGQNRAIAARGLCSACWRKAV